MLGVHVLGEFLATLDSYLRLFSRNCYFVVQNPHSATEDVLFLEFFDTNQKYLNMLETVYFNPYFGYLRPENYKNDAVSQIEKSIPQIREMREVFALDVPDEQQIQQTGRKVLRVNRSRYPTKSVLFRFTTPFLYIVIEVLQGKKVLFHNKFSFHEDELHNEKGFEIQFQAEDVLYTQLTFRAYQKGMADDADLSIDEHDTSLAQRRSNHEPGNIVINLDRLNEYQNEEHQDYEEPNESDFDQFLRLNYAQDLLVSSFRREQVVFDLFRIPIRFMRDEQWKLYSRFEQGLVWGHEMKIRHLASKKFVGTVNVRCAQRLKH